MILANGPYGYSLAPPGANGRQTYDPRYPTMINGTLNETFQFVPRKSPIKIDLDNIDKLQRELKTQPHLLLRQLRTVSPGLNLALNNAMQIALPSNTLVVEWKNEDGSVNVKETEYLKGWIKTWPRETGTITKFARMLMGDAFLSDKKVIEVVPDSMLLGGAQSMYCVWPDSIFPIRKYGDDDIAMCQLKKRTLNGDVRYIYEELDPFNVLWDSNQPTSDAPEGSVPWASALLESLGDLIMTRDLRDAVENVGQPTRDFGIDIENLHKIAVEHLGITNANEAKDYVMSMWKEIEKMAMNTKANQNTVHDSKGSIRVNNGGNFGYVEPALDFLRNRHVISMLSLPSLHGIGGNTNIGSIEYQLYATMIESSRSDVLRLICSGLDRAQELRGVRGYSEITGCPIKTSDELVEASIREIKLRTGVLETALGFISLDTLCREMRGKEREGKELDGVIESVAKVVATPDANNSRQTNRTSTANQPAPGNSKPST